MKGKAKKERKSKKEKIEIPHVIPNDIRYEKARIIGIRAMQLLQGAEPFIKVPPGITDPIKIAELEYEAGKLPFIIKRGDDTGSENFVSLSELKKS